MMPRTVVCCIHAIRTGCEHCRTATATAVAVAIAIAIAAAGSGPFVWGGVTLWCGVAERGMMCRGVMWREN